MLGEAAPPLPRDPLLDDRDLRGDGLLRLHDHPCARKLDGFPLLLRARLCVEGRVKRFTPLESCRISSCSATSRRRPPPASVSCYSPRIHALFETHSGHYHLLDPSEAASTAQDFTKEVGKGGGACGAATRNRYQCFAYATTERILDATRVGAYIGSLVKGEPAACRERVCS